MRRRLAVMAAIGLLIGVIGVPPATAGRGRLDGKTFAIPTLHDELKFQDGQLITARSAESGYRPANYLAMPWDGGIGFRASLRTAQGRTMRWEGLIKGDAVDGRVFTLEGRRRVETPFTGTLVRTAAAPTKSGHAPCCCER